MNLRTFFRASSSLRAAVAPAPRKIAADLTSKSYAGQRRVDLTWMEVVTPNKVYASDFLGDREAAFSGGDSAVQRGESHQFARRPYSDAELKVIRKEREEGVEKRADGSTPVYWAPEYSSEVLRGNKFRVKVQTAAKWDDRAQDVLPGDLALPVWERQIKYGKRSAHHISPWYDARGMRQYKVHEFPAGKFLEVCGNLVRLDYTIPMWAPGIRSMQKGNGHVAYIHEFFPEHSFYARYRSGMASTIKEFFADLKALGPVALAMKIYRLKWTWWAAEGKVLVGIDSNGLKYWEGANPAGLSHRMRWVELPWSRNWSVMDDIHPQWRMWLGRAVSNPPNEIESWPVFAQEFAYNEARWHHFFGVSMTSHSLKHFGTGMSRSLRTGSGLDDRVGQFDHVNPGAAELSDPSRQSPLLTSYRWMG